jgi:hypothetical protein
MLGYAAGLSKKPMSKEARAAWAVKAREEFAKELKKES